MGKINVTFKDLGHVFLALDDDGKNYRIFLNEPFKKNPDKVSSSLEEYIENSLGEGAGTVDNPIIVRIAGSRINRCVPITEEDLKAIQSGESEGDCVKDMDGNYIEILPRRSSDEKFPLNGILYDEKGAATVRNYALDGTCKDRDEMHRIAIFHETD